MAIKRRDFQKLSSTVQEFLLKLPDEEPSARLRDNLLHALHFLQLYYRVLQSRDKNNDPLQWTIDHSLSPLTPFREAPDKFDWEWINVESQKVRQSLPKSSIENFRILPQIITSIKEGDLNAIKQIVKQDPQSVNNTDSFSRDCITYAIQLDKYDILKFLLSNGANANNIASDSSTSLHRAVYKNNSEMVQLLLENKANINAQDSFNRAPLHWSVVNPNVECLKILLKFNPNLQIKDKDGMSPAMWACHLDHLEHFKLLTKLDDVNKNIDLNNLEQDNDGRTWMHWCVRKNEPFQCLNFLLNNETVMIRDKDGKTCLHVAAEQGALHACKLIIDVAGNKIVNEKDGKKQTPLHLATLNGHARTIKILMDNGADVNMRDITGASPIDYVTKRNLFFCNSIIEICLRNYERKSRQGASSTNSLASSLNGSESNLTPAPPTTPKNTFTRTFQQQFLPKDLTGRPPRPTQNLNNSLSLTDNYANNSNELSKTAPGSLTSNTTNNGISLTNGESFRNNGMNIPPSPPTTVKTRPNNRGGWNSAERIMSGSLRLSRASTRTSLASDDLEKYMTNSNGLSSNDKFGGSLNNVENLNSTLQPIGFSNTTNNIVNTNNKPLPQPRNASTNSATNNRIISGRNQETALSTSSYDLPNYLSQMPPPIKPRKSSSVQSLNNSIDNQNHLGNSTRSNRHPQNDLDSNKPNFNGINYSNLTNKNVPINNINTNNNNNLNVEDISGDELSITSVKGEGFASDLSDNEIKNQHQHMHMQQTLTNKRAKIKNTLKRPTTPMDVRNSGNDHHQVQSQQQKSANKQTSGGTGGIVLGNVGSSGGLKFQQLGDQNVTSTRFNEWDPYGASRVQQQQIQIQNDRQKSPLKSKQALQQQNQNSNFAHTFLNTDSSPRQSSGRSQVGSANVNNQKLHQISPQQQQQSAITGMNGGLNTSGSNQNETGSSSNLDLMVSGQKLGRKDASPTSTPRDANQQHQQSPQHITQQERQKPFTRRLQPLDKLAVDQSGLNTTNENQFLKQKNNTSNTRVILDRKKLEPIKLNFNLNNSTSHVDSVSTGQSLTEDGQNINNEEEPSISENTLSNSDKQIFNNIRVNKKKKFNQQNRKKFMEPIGNDAN